MTTQHVLLLGVDHWRSALSDNLEVIVTETTGNSISTKAVLKNAVALFQDIQSNAIAATKQVYEEVLLDHDRLVREIDIIINGLEGAAKQASLCDLVGQIKDLVNDNKRPTSYRNVYTTALLDAALAILNDTARLSAADEYITNAFEQLGIARSKLNDSI